ncbi:MAG TPA: response regulator transcription factor [Flavisolibacter sp.]
MYSKIRVIIADDHEMLRKGFHVLLRKQTDIEIIGEAADGRELLQKVRELEPDVVITDIQMPVMDGIEATRQLVKEYPYIGVLALTMFNEDHLIVSMLEAGARGYLLKNTNQFELAEAIKAIHNGGTYFCMTTSEKLKQMISNSQYNPARHHSRPQFTEKEIQVMELICEEYQNKEIADKMHLSVRTVENYRERIFEKTGAKTIAGITIYAIKNGYFKIK